MVLKSPMGVIDSNIYLLVSSKTGVSALRSNMVHTCRAHPCFCSVKQAVALLLLTCSQAMNSSTELKSIAGFVTLSLLPLHAIELTWIDCCAVRVECL